MKRRKMKLTKNLGYTMTAVGLAAMLALTACTPGSAGESQDSAVQAGMTGEGALEDGSGVDGDDPGIDSGAGEVTKAAAETGVIRYCTAEDLGVPCGRLADKLDLSGYQLADLTDCGYSHSFSGAEMEELLDILGELVCVDARELHIYEDYAGWNLELQLDYEALYAEIESYYENLDPDMDWDEIDSIIPVEVQKEFEDKIERYPRINLTMSLTTQGYCILGPEDVCCLLTPELQKYFAKYREIPERTTEKVYYSVACKEPETEIECRDAAVLCVTEWLKECKKEGTDPEFRNHGFTIAEDRKNNFRAGGYVDGRKEFLVEVCFTAEYDEDAKFYRRHEIAHYTDAGTFWEGVYLKGRFCWEDGMVSLLDPMGNDLFLDGFQTAEYRNFYEYARRSDLEQAIQDSFVPYMGVVVSQNLTVTENGKEINLDIYQMGNIEVREDTVFGDPDFRTYHGEEKFYGTGVYFTDMGTSTKEIEYPKSFRLTFDNYTNDGNPDYAILYDTDENGAYYAIESVQSDGRVFNHSGRAYQGGVYVAGCFDPSPRLQRTEDVDYIGWKIDKDGKYVPYAYGNYEMKLPEINMYSDRLYLPGTLKLYLPEETSVTCFLWNNTAKPMDTKGEFQIERLEGEEWITVAQGKSAESKTVAPRECVEMTYDLGVIPDRQAGRYRVVQQAGSFTGYGEFQLTGEGQGGIEVEPAFDTLPEGCLTAALTLTNNGMEPRRVPELTLRKEGGGEVPIWLESRKNQTQLGSGESMNVQFFCAGEGLSAGRYELLLGQEKKASFEVKSGGASSQILAVQMERGTDSQKVGINVRNLGKEPVEIREVYFYQLRNGRYEMCYLTVTEDYRGSDEIPVGESRKMIFENVLLTLLNDEILEEFYKEWQENQEEMEELGLLEEYGIPADASFEEFSAAMRKPLMVDEDAPLMVEISYGCGGVDMIAKVKDSPAGAAKDIQ